MTTRPTSAVIHTGALEHNYRELRKRLNGSMVMAVVKANAYGHGDIEVSRIFEALGCEYFGVAIPEEGARLRKAGIKRPIVVLGGVFHGALDEIFKYRLTPVVCDIKTARAIDVRARKTGTPKKVHVKIDTGMGRLGLLPHQVMPFFEGFKRLKHLRLEAILSHFVESELKDKTFSKGQLAVFLEAVEAVKALGFTPDFIDMANSAAAVDYEDSRLNLIRPGIMLYGSYPAKRLRKKIGLRPVMELKTRVLHLKHVPPGASVSYGRRFTAKRTSVIATLPIGYADGLPRSLSCKGEVLIRGQRAPIAGTVCMDLTMCDVTDIKGVKAGDEAVIIGRQGAEEISAEDIAEKCGTISYEIFCNVSQRVPRVYVW